MIGKVRLTSIKRNCFIMVAIDYFIKWVEYKPYRDVNERYVICFIKEMTIHRFGIPQSITINQGLLFNGARVREFA